MKGERLTGAKEIADYLGISTRTVYRWHSAKDNNFPVRQSPGSRTLVSFTDALDRWQGFVVPVLD